MKRITATVCIGLAVLAGTVLTVRKVRSIHIQDDFMEYFGIGYSDIVSFIVQGYQCHWDGIDPDDGGVSGVLRYESPLAGSCLTDLDGDGIGEMLLGDEFDDGTHTVYDIYGFDRTTGDVIHLFSGGERNWCRIHRDGTVEENGSNSAEDSFTRYWKVSGTKLKKAANPESEELMNLHMDKFEKYARPRQLAGGYTDNREPTEEEMLLFRQTTDLTPQDQAPWPSGTHFTPLSVATQVVAGLNYRFWCRFQAPDSYGHCNVVIYRPLSGEPRVTSFEIVE